MGKSIYQSHQQVGGSGPRDGQDDSQIEGNHNFHG
jgi:hypothetical protein